MIFNLVGREEPNTPTAHSSRGFLDIGGRMCDRVFRQPQVLGWGIADAKRLFDAAGAEEGEHANLRRTNDEGVRLESREKDAATGAHREALFSREGVKVAFDHIEELVLAGVHMRRRFVSRLQKHLHEAIRAVRIARVGEIGDQVAQMPLRDFKGWSALVSR